MNIQHRIITNTVIISCLLILLSIVSLTVQSNKLSHDLLFSVQKDRLTSIRYFKTLEIESYFNNLIENISILSTNREIINGLQDFSRTFPKYAAEAIGLKLGYKAQVVDNYLNTFTMQYKNYNNDNLIDAKNLVNLLSENSFALQYNYIFNNPYNLSNKERLIAPQDGTNYSFMHAKYHTSILARKQQFGFYDILLVDGDSGNIVYSVNKELDFTTSLINGPYAQSTVAEIFRKVMSSEQNNFIAIADFAPYLAFYNNPAAFIGIAVKNELGTKIGAMIIQISVEKINKIMSNQEQWKKIGLGSTINTSIIGSDLKLRTNNRFFLENKDLFLNQLKMAGTDKGTIEAIQSKNSLIGILTTDTLAVKKAFAGEEGFSEYIDYLQHPVVSSYAPLNIPGLNWVIVVKMSKNEALSWMLLLQQKITHSGITIAIFLGVVAFILGKFTAKIILNYIYNITEQINNISRSQDLTKRLTVKENSEFSVMINAFNNFITNLQLYLKNIVEISEQVHIENLKNNSAPSSIEGIKQPNNSNNLYDKISILSKSFKLIEDEKERTKYW